MTDNKITCQHNFTFKHNDSDVDVSIKSFEKPAKKSELSGELYTTIDIFYKGGKVELSLPDVFDEKQMKVVEKDIKKRIYSIIPQPLN